MHGPYEVLERAHVKALGVFKVVHDAAGRAHDNVRPLGQGDRLRHVVDAANDHRRAHADVGAEALKVFGDLERELAVGSAAGAGARIRGLGRGQGAWAWARIRGLGQGQGQGQGRGLGRGQGAVRKGGRGAD